MNIAAETTQELPSLPRKRIEDVIPHRSPFLLIDSVAIMTAEYVTCVRQLTGDEGFFRGHFPGNPIMPGFLQAEAIAQTAAYWLLSQPEHAGKNVFLRRAETKFLRPIVPPAEMRIKAFDFKNRGRIYRGKGIIMVDGQETCQATISCVLTGP